MREGERDAAPSFLSMGKRNLTRALPLAAAVLALMSAQRTFADSAARTNLIRAVLSEDNSEQIALVKKLIDADDVVVAQGLAAWRLGSLYLTEGETKIPFLLDVALDSDGKAKGLRLLDGEPLLDQAGKPLLFSANELTPVDTTSKLRQAIKIALDLYALANRNPKMRRDAAIKLGQEQNADYLAYLEPRLRTETNKEVRKALAEAIALTQIASTERATRMAAITRLKELRSVNSLSFLQKLEKESEANPAAYGGETVRAAHLAVKQIEDYLWWGNLFGTAFRGLSLAAVLLVVALGLAITFGLMGIINMAHGEIMMVGAYAAFVVQNFFKS